MMTRKFLAGSATRLMSCSGSPSTSRRSARAATSTTPSLPRYGLRLPDKANNSALVDVAMISASAGVYQRTRETRMAPCRCASARENSTSVPHAVLILYFFARGICFSDPGEDFVGLFSLDRPFWKTGPQFVGQRLQTQTGALVGYQLRGGLVHHEPMLDALHSCRNGLLDRFGREGMHGNASAPVLGGSTAARSSGSVKVTTSIGLNGDETPPPAVSFI